MKWLKLPGCCTATLLNQMGSAAHAGHVDYYHGEQLGTVTLESVKDYVESRRLRGDAFVAVVTSHDQENANAVLAEVGFDSSPWMKKKKNADTSVKLWWYELGKTA